MGIFADFFTDMMATTVTVYRRTSQDTYGAPAYGPAMGPYEARVNNVQRNVIGPTGQMVVSRGRAWLDTVDDFGVNDKVVLGDGTTPKLLNVNQVPDENGPCYTSFDFQ